MNKRKYALKALSLTVMFTLVFTSCGDDDAPPVAPVITIDNATFTGDLGELATAIISGTLEGDFVVMEIRKFIGTDPDDTWGTGGVMEVTTGLPYTFSYELGADGIENPIRFNFLVEDSNGLTGETNFIITTDASRRQLLTTFNWRYSSLIWEDDPTVESILECEEDNVFNFEEDGTMGVDYGALTGSGGGSCDFDGFLIHTGWAMNEAQDTLQWFRADAFTLEPQDTVTYSITEFDQMQWVADETNLFGVFAYTYTAVPKN